MSDIILYTTDDGLTKLDLRLEDGTIWLSQMEIAELFQTSKQNISKHLQAIFDDQELDTNSTVNQKLTVQKEVKIELHREGRNKSLIFRKLLSLSAKKLIYMQYISVK